MPLSADFLANPRQFCLRWICIMPGTTNEGAKLPSPGPSPMVGGALPAPGTPWVNTGQFFNNRAPGEHMHKMGYNVAAAATQVCWHQLDDHRLKLMIQGSTDANALGGALTDWFPCYFLPLGPGQIGRMLLPAQPSATVAAPVRAFFTAEMNGCSFLAAGNPASPLVSHYNVSQGNANLSQAQKDQIQSDMVKAMLRAKRGGPNLGGTSAGVLRKVAAAGGGDGLSGTRIAESANTPYALTPAEEQIVNQMVAAELRQRNLKEHGMAGAGATILDIRIATMGTLDSGNRRWSFFYQRNVMAQTQAIARLGRMGGLIKLLGQDNRAPQYLARYLRIPGWEYNVLWPGGTGHVAIPAHGDPDQA
jgi:hypothetical protein